MQTMIDVTPDLLLRLEYQISDCSYLVAVAGPGVLNSCRYPIEAEWLHHLTRVWQQLSIMACLNVRLSRAPRTILSNHASRAYDNRENHDWEVPTIRAVARLLWCWRRACQPPSESC
jgi:hypothetical protein